MAGIKNKSWFIKKSIEKHSDFFLSFGHTIKKIRRCKGISRANFAESVGFSFNHLRHVEQGIANMRIETLHKVASALGVRIEIHLKPTPAAVSQQPYCIPVSNECWNQTAWALKQIRLDAKISQKNLSLALKASHHFIFTVEKRKVHLSLCRLLDIAGALGYEVEMYLNGAQV